MTMHGKLGEKNCIVFNGFFNFGHFYEYGICLKTLKDFKAIINKELFTMEMPVNGLLFLKS